jgi:very-short-patch-repair endonuclease
MLAGGGGSGGQTVSVPTVRYECLVTTRRQLEYARQMRRQSTRAEIYLWQHVRGKQLGVRFRRQHPIGPYIADFACVSRKVIVEVDGDSHDYRSDSYARRRQRWLERQGWTILHFADEYVLENIDGTLAVVEHVLADPSAAGQYRD